MAPHLLVSIINYRTGEMTCAAAQSVLDALKDRPAQVVIVDNASGDGSDMQIEDWIARTGDSRLSLVRSTTNSGFSGGHNQGMQLAPEADLYLILNSDALLRPDFFDHLLPAAQDAPDVGLFGPRLEWEDGKIQVSNFRFATPVSELIRAAQTSVVTKLFNRFKVPLGIDPKQEDIQWASFACILLRGSMVRQIGWMDDGYFLYFEDEEYALRAHRAGWNINHVPAARAVHFKGGSGPVKTLQAAKKRLPDYYYRSRTRFLRQRNGPLGPLLANVLWHVGRGIAQSRRLLGRKAPPVHESEWRDIWTGFLRPLEPDPRSPAKERHA